MKRSVYNYTVQKYDLLLNNRRLPEFNVLKYRYIALNLETAVDR